MNSLIDLQLLKSAVRIYMITWTFLINRNGISASAICAYNVSDILKSYAGKFKSQANPNSNWLPADNEPVSWPIRPPRVILYFVQEKTYLAYAYVSVAYPRSLWVEVSWTFSPPLKIVLKDMVFWQSFNLGKYPSPVLNKHFSKPSPCHLWTQPPITIHWICHWPGTSDLK